MAVKTDLVALRKLLEPVIERLVNMHTHETLGCACELVGLPTPPPPDEGTKRDRVRASFAALPDAALAHVATNLLSNMQIDARSRNAIQDTVWAGRNSPAIEKPTRRNIARDLDLANLVIRHDRFIDLLDHLWVLDDNPFGEFLGAKSSLRDRINQHVCRNPGDWSPETLFDELGAFEASDRRFALFLEGLASALHAEVSTRVVS